MRNSISKNILIWCLLAGMNIEPIYANETERLDRESVIIIGSGIGALTTSIFLARSGLHPIIISGKNYGGALSQSSSIQNWPGEYDINGLELLKKIQDQAVKNGVEFREDEVVSVDFSTMPFSIKMQDLTGKNKKSELQVYSCVIATGSEPNKLNVKGESEYWNKGVHSCAVCDGTLYKDKTVAVVGGGDSALLDTQYLSQIAKKVYVIIRKNELKANEKKRAQALSNQKNVTFLFNTQVKEIKGADGNVTALVLEKDSSYSMLDVDGVFLAIGSKPNSQLFLDQIKLDKNGYVIKDSCGKTSVNNVFAVGDVADPYVKQAITAAADGAKAAIALTDLLFQNSSHIIRDVTDSNSIKKAENKKMQTISNFSEASDRVVHIKDYNQFLEEVGSATVPVVVDFFASWCGPCRRLSPKLDAIAKELKGKVKILKVDVQKNSNLADRYKIRSMPTLIALKGDGKEGDRREGVGEIMQYFDSLR